jgi:hypothetical protein
MGLRGIDDLRLTRNRSVLVSFRRGVLRVQEGYLQAPEPSLRAIVDFVGARTRRGRREAGRRLTENLPPRPARIHPRHRTHRDDARIAERLAEWHAEFNEQLFGGKLRSVPIHVSRRMRTRLGHYSASSGEDGPEIVMSRRHIRRDGHDEARHTLIHEMVHQWQDENGLPIDHGAVFRRKCREVGISPRATRDLRERVSASHATG